MTADLDAFDVGWHCLCCLEPAPPHCEHCPPPGECDVLGCDEPGCSGVELDCDVELDTTGLIDTSTAVECDLRLENRRLRRLLQRVIDDDRDPTALRQLSQDIAIELGVSDPLAQN